MTQKKERKKPRLKSDVCKPCWELKYCPYGPLVEQFPLRPHKGSLANARAVRAESRAELFAGGKRSADELTDICDRFLYAEPSTWHWIMQYDTSDLVCDVFGHVCPVFLVAEGFTETAQIRRTGRRIPHDIMVKVVRRDGHVCQICVKPVPDDQVEFDHIIPFSRGGPLTAENIRLVCRTCNRKKRDSLTELLDHSLPNVLIRLGKLKETDAALPAKPVATNAAGRNHADGDAPSTPRALKK